MIVFQLSPDLADKADPALVAADERHFADIQRCLDESIADLERRLAATRRERAGRGQRAVERDQAVHRLSGQLRLLQRYGLDLCLGHMVPADTGEPVYIGRLGLSDPAGRHLLVDWRAPAAEPFFAATHADPMGLVSRRRYRWSAGRISDYWDEVFDPAAFTGHAAALDDQSTFIASLGADRSERMRDVLATIAADQDAIIRAPARGALVVDGGPGTGKTVVALHRAAYLLYADPRLRRRRGGVLIVGPHRPYLDYVADVLPSLGEDDVQLCTVSDLVAEGADARPEPDPGVAALKASLDLVHAIEPAVRFHEQPPTRPTELTTAWGAVTITPEAWGQAFATVDPGTAHNDAQEPILKALVDAIVAGVAAPERAPLRAALLRDRELRMELNRVWPLIDATELVADLWSVPAFLRHCAPSLDAGQRRLLRRPNPQSWTAADLPILDAARYWLGDPAASRRRRRREAALAAQRARMDQVVDEVQVTDDDYEAALLKMLRGEDLRAALVDESVVVEPEPDLLAGPFAHLVVDEAQELTDAQWQMLLRRCPSGSLTVVGDRAQARHGFTETWQQRLTRVGAHRITRAGLTINYRTPAEVMAEAEPVIRAVLPDANVPTSIRSTGVPVRHGVTGDLPAILAAWRRRRTGIACVIGDPSVPATPRVRSLTPELAKGLEFDLVVLVDPGAWGSGIEGAVDRYVAMTRATQQLVILTRGAAG